MQATFEGFPDNINVAPYKAAFNNAKHIVSKAYRSAVSVKTMNKRSPAYRDVLAAYTRFWGNNNSTTVASRLRILKNALISADLKIIYSTDDDGGTTKAFIYEDDQAPNPGGAYTPNIYFCPPLIKGYAALGTNSASGSIIHEMSHLILATDDKTYKMKSCSELSDANKLVNADNYKYYCELFFLARLSLMPALSDAYDLSHRPPR
ncbi:MAG: M35 family metallo-endopeptidase [Planctomycetota bacterium]|jgi:hypothetical protein